MATNTQFSIAVHLLISLAFNCEREMTSANLAMSVNTSPSFVRRILAKLSKANLVSTTTGKAGFCSLAKSAEDISLLEIYKAVDAPKAFAIHKYPVQTACAVSCNIEAAMEKVLAKTQQSLESGLSEINLAEVLSGINTK
jgi:Rrf2 family protein